MTTTYFTSDLHFGHLNIIDYSARPFADVDEMNATLIDNWNATVSDDDIVWVLGDVALGKIADTLPLVDELNGVKNLLCGNHDRPWRGHKKTGTWLQRYLDAGFARVVDGGSLVFTFEDPPTENFAILNHFPYAGDSHDVDRFTAHRPKDEGHWLLHGHVHEAWKVKGRQINVGVDVWDYRPVAVDELVALFA